MKHLRPLILACILSSCASSDRLSQSQPETIPDRNGGQLAASGSTLSMDASKWNFHYGVNTPKHPTQDGSGFKFTFFKDKTEVDYLTTSHSSPITASAIEFTIAVEGATDTWFDHVTESGNIPGGIPSSCRFVLQRDVTTEFGRWFSNPFCIELRPRTTQLLRVPLTPENWSSVYGKFGDYNDAARKGFARVLSSPVSVGLVFGGGNFFGHGLRARSGNAIVKILSYRLVP